MAAYPPTITVLGGIVYLRTKSISFYLYFGRSRLQWTLVLGSCLSSLVFALPVKDTNTVDNNAPWGLQCDFVSLRS